MKDLLPVIVQPFGGLCNRMRAIAAAAKLADMLGRKMCVLWTRDASLNAPFYKLFDKFPFPVIELHSGSFKHRLIMYFCRRVLCYKFYDDVWVNKYARKKPYESWCNCMISHPIYIITCSDIFMNGVDYSIFHLADDLQSRTLPSFNNVIGIHIRRSDNEESIRFSPTKLFISKIDEEIAADPTVRFYLATDDPIEEENFLSKYPDKITVYKKGSLDRNTPIAIRDAVIDLYNLAHCRKIYGSYWSSFSNVAALWGGIEKEVLKID